jgi:transposase
MKQQRLIRLMERLIRVSKQKVFLILDNLKVHHSKLAASWLEHRKDKIEVFFLPPYAPGYNPDEYLNHALKISVHSGQLPIPGKISVIRFSHSCTNCNIIPFSYQASSIARCFPVFACRSNRCPE